MDVLASRLLFDQNRASSVSCRGERMHALGGICMEASCGVWWIDFMVLGNGDGFVPSSEGR